MSSSSVTEDRCRLDGFEVEIFKLVQKEATSEQWREWLRAPLEHAAAHGKVDLFARLMDAGADGSAGWRGCRGRTLLGAAAYGGSEKMVLDLLRAGAEDELGIMFDDYNGCRTSALHEAVHSGAESVSQALMLAGADPNLLDGDGNTPLDWAAQAGHTGIVSNLVLKGARLDGANSPHQTTPLHLAAEAGHVLCVCQLLLGGADKNALDIINATPLLLAARSNHVGVVEKLLVAGADLRLADEDGWNPVERAAQEGNVVLLKIMLENGGEADAADDDGYTPLHATGVANACENDNSGAVRVLLEAGADIEAKTNEGFTPLHQATEGRRIATIGALLEGGADINARSGADFTPLRCACANSDVAVVELLLRWGADETLTYTNGKTVVDSVGLWEEDDDVEDQQRRADDEHIRQMLARAPADRSWRRRGWLVLCRSRRSKELATDNSGDNRRKSVKGARLDGIPSIGKDAAGDSAVSDLGYLASCIIGLEAEDVFRLVVGFF